MKRPIYYDQNRMRFELLRALYMHAQRHPNEPFSETELEDEFCVSPIQFDQVVDWLVGSGLVQVSSPSGHLAITEKGIAEMDERAAFWRRSVDEINDWLTEEKARIARECGNPNGSNVGISRTEIALKREAVLEARRRRIALETRMRDMRESFYST